MANTNKTQQGKSVIGNTLGAMLVTVIAKVLGFVRTAVCAAIFGATASLDAFNLGITVIGMLTGPASSMTTVIVPARTHLLDQEGRERADRFSSSFLNAALLLSAVATVLALALSPWIVRIFSTKAEIHDLTLSIVRLFIPLTIPAAVIYMFNGILNTHKRFTPPNAIIIVLNICWMLGAVLLYKRLGIYAAVIGYMSGFVLQMFVVIPASRGIFSYKGVLDWKDSELRRAFIRCIPIFVGSFSSSIGQAVDKALASSLAVGSVSAINYAAQLIALVQGIIILPIITTVFTSLAEYVQAKDMDGLTMLISKAHATLALVLLPITVYCVLYDQEIVRIVYQRGAFDDIANLMTSQVLAFYALSLLPMGVGLTITRCFYAYQDTKTPLYTSIAGIATDIILNYALIGMMGLRGLALATSVSAFLSCGLQMYFLRKKIGFTGMGRLIRQAWKMLIALAALVAVVIIVRTLTAGMGALISLVLATVAGLAIYASLLLLLKQEEMQQMLQYVRPILTRRK